MKVRLLGRRLLVGANHAPVAHQGDALTAQLLFDLVDLLAEGLEVAGVAPINLDGNRLALAVGQQADHDLFFAFLVVAVISPGRQGVVVALQIAAGHIVEKELVLGLGGAGLPEAAFDDGVAAFQPGAIGVEIVFGEGAAPAQQGGGGAGGGQADHGQQGGAGAQARGPGPASSPVRPHGLRPGLS